MTLKSYSQNAEDLFIIDAGIEVRSVLDIGANDGIRSSNSRIFIERFDAKALLVEPDPEAFCQLFNLYKQHPNVALLHAAMVADAPASGRAINFYQFGDTLKSTGSEFYRNLCPVPPRGMFGMATIGWYEMLHWYNLLSQDGGCARFDLISIGAEGATLELAECMPEVLLSHAKAIIVEHALVAAPGIGRQKASMKAFSGITSRGFRAAHQTYENLIFLR